MDEPELLTASDAFRRQRALAGGLVARGVRAGDRVLLGATPNATMLCAVLGALRVGIVPVVLNGDLLPHERAELAADADAALELDDAVLVRMLDEGRAVDLADAPLARPMHYTSGTTGRAKGVWSGVLTEDEGRALLAEEIELWGFGPTDVHLVCSPLHHSVAIRFAGATLLAGGDVVLLGRFAAERAVATLASVAPTTTFMVPAHLQRLFALGEPPPSPQLRLLAHAGAPCPPALKHQAIAAFGLDAVHEFYGSTEGQFTACTAAEWLERPGTVGRARPGRTLAVDDGVIWCRPPAHARWEYWRDAERTAAAWRDGAFTVGDLGRLDDDGYLYLDGRRDDLVITGGVNVYPAEVERVLEACPGVQAVAVFGVDDERWGQRVCAAVVGSDVDEAAVRSWARTHLAGHKRPKEVFVVEGLPHTATGKLQRGRVAAQLGLA